MNRLLPTLFKRFVDVFGGSGTVTLNLQLPKGCLQIYNDLNAGQPYYEAECYAVAFPRSDHQRLHDALVVSNAFVNEL